MKPKERERYLKDEEILKYLHELDNESDSELESSSFSESEPDIPLAKSTPKQVLPKSSENRNATNVPFFSIPNATNVSFISGISPLEREDDESENLGEPSPEESNRHAGNNDNFGELSPKRLRLDNHVIHVDTNCSKSNHSQKIADSNVPFEVFQSSMVMDIADIAIFTPSDTLDDGTDSYYLIPIDVESFESSEKENTDSTNAHSSPEKHCAVSKVSEPSTSKIYEPSTSKICEPSTSTISNSSPPTSTISNSSTSDVSKNPCSKKRKQIPPKKKKEIIVKKVRKTKTPQRRRVWRKCPVTIRSIKLHKFDHQGSSGPNPAFVTADVKTAFDFFSLYLTDELLDKIVEETNRYAEQCIVNRIVMDDMKENARIATWTDTTKEEIRNFIGIIMWMGLDQKPTLAHYWSSIPLYAGKTSEYMSRNRFELILRYIHFADNETADKKDKMYKIRYVMDYLNDKFSKMFIPEKQICIDETMMAFKGRLSFKQYISNKRHKWGIKFFKLCLPHGYTFRFKIYSGADNDQEDNVTLSEDVVIKLCEGVLDQGRTLYVDNFYTSVSLAERLLRRKTHLVGTLRSNRKENPKLVKKKRLEKGEIISQISKGIIVSKWKDKKDVLFLSTKHRPNFVLVKSKRTKRISLKPTAVAEYNDAKTFIDVSDQIKSYGSPTRRGVKWFRKVFIEILCNAAVVNAYILYVSKNNPKRLTITQFREQLVMALLQPKTKSRPDSILSPNSVKHKLLKLEGRNRGRYATCYQRVSSRSGRAVATKLPWMHYTCTGCVEKYTCLECFNKMHYSKRL